MRNEAIVLAGGLGTRLRSSVADKPKSMAPVAGKPFLEYTLDLLIRAGVNHTILAVGYKHEEILSYFGQKYKDMSLSYSIENEPMGTGGAIVLALEYALTDTVWVLNGDTLFDCDFSSLHLLHQEKNADLTLALKPMSHAERYGTVQIGDSSQIIGFEEKKTGQFALVNAGVYRLCKSTFLNHVDSGKFSFEKDFLENRLDEITAYGSVQDRYFLDIGIPSDYQKAQFEFPVFEKVRKIGIGHKWTLFIIWEGFENESQRDIVSLCSSFYRTVIISGQHAKRESLSWSSPTEIKQPILGKLTDSTSNIEVLYFSSELENNQHPNHEHETRIIEMIIKEWKDIDFQKSLIVSRSPEYVKIARRFGMTHVLISPNMPTHTTDFYFKSMAQAASLLG